MTSTHSRSHSVRTARAAARARLLPLAAAALLAGCGDDDPTPADASAVDSGVTDLGAPDVVDAGAPDVPRADVPATDVPRADVQALDVPGLDAPDVPAADVPAADGAVPAVLAFPAGQTEVLRVSARGVQIYTCTATASDAGVGDGGAPYQWVFRAPEATLYDAAGNLFGTHFAGPNWRAVDGSQITGAVQQRADAPVAGAIPWLLLRVTGTTGAGVLSRVASVQRLDTVGGVAPTTACNAGNVGAEVGVDYTATYAFAAPTSDAAAPAAPLPAALNVPEAGLRVLLRAAAQGDQVYRCDAVTPDGGADAGAPYQWTFVSPTATLYDSAMATIGTHSAGPTWRTTDGSQVVGAVAARADSPAAGAIPWLLLRAASNAGTGTLSRARFVHRVATTGGVAPATGCDASSVGTMRNVTYTADYYFWGAP